MDNYYPSNTLACSSDWSYTVATKGTHQTVIIRYKCLTIMIGSKGENDLKRAGVVRDPLLSYLGAAEASCMRCLGWQVRVAWRVPEAGKQSDCERHLHPPDYQWQVRGKKEREGGREGKGDTRKEQEQILMNYNHCNWEIFDLKTFCTARMYKI